MDRSLSRIGFTAVCAEISCGISRSTRKCDLCACATELMITWESFGNSVGVVGQVDSPRRAAMWTISFVQRHVWFQALTYRSLLADAAHSGPDVPRTFHHDEIVFYGLRARETLKSSLDNCASRYVHATFSA